LADEQRNRPYATTNDKYKLQIENQGFFTDEVPGDGNCFFYATAIHQYEDKKHHCRVRDECCEWIEENPVDFVEGSLLINGKSVTMSEYLAEMRKPKTFADNPILVAAAQIYKRNIHVHRAKDAASDPTPVVNIIEYRGAAELPPMHFSLQLPAADFMGAHHDPLFSIEEEFYSNDSE
jgi:hypothetical protein